MRVTKNTKDSICPVCKELMKAGELGTNFMIVMPHIQRAHVECVKRVHEERIEKYARSK